jgi:cysteinyl-tRNA synthetase
MDSTKTAYQKLVSRIAALSPEEGAIDTEAFDALRARFAEAMDNDLNTALAVTALYYVLKAKTDDATKRALIADFDRVLSLGLLEAAEKVRIAQKAAADAAKAAPDAELVVTCLTEGVDPATRSEVEALIRERADAKKAKDFAAADAIRDRLAAMGVTLKDAKGAVSWEMK